MRAVRTVLAACSLVLLVGAASGCAALADVAPTAGPAPTLDAPWAGAPAVAPASAPSGSAAEALATLPVKGRAPKTGYSRDQFGQRWADVDHNGCDQRNDILARDMPDETFTPGSRCVVAKGTLDDPYTGKTIAFTRGQGTSEAVQIDHVVALSDAWQKGAQQLDVQARTSIANDPLNLLAVDGPTNNAKGDGDAATWLPPNRGYRCAYVARQVAVKAKYGLWVTAAERDAIASVLQSCPGEPLPTDPTLPAPARTPGT